MGAKPLAVREWKLLSIGMMLVLLVLGGCAHGGKPKEAAAPPPAPRPTPHLRLHWADAGDTTRTLRWPSNKPFRTDLTMTGLVDSVAGFEIQFRMEPTTTDKGSAWRFANNGNCLAAVWAGTVEADPKAPAPWPHKLAITDVRPLEDGTTVFVVSATFDYVKLNPDSVYSLCHMDFQPPEAASDSVHCAGWDAPVRLYVEQAQLLFGQNILQPVFEVGKPLVFEPVPAR